jgi:hypothetical protein
VERHYKEVGKSAQHDRLDAGLGPLFERAQLDGEVLVSKANDLRSGRARDNSFGLYLMK